MMLPRASVRRASTRKFSPPKDANIDSNPDKTPRVVDGQGVLRASPDIEEMGEQFEAEKVTAKKGEKVTAPAIPKPEAEAPSFEMVIVRFV